jgi:hypothetical protein
MTMMPSSPTFLSSSRTVSTAGKRPENCTTMTASCSATLIAEAARSILLDISAFCRYTGQSFFDGEELGLK